MDLDAIYNEYHEDVARFVRIRLGRHADVRDVCQEVWAAVARSMSRLEGRASVRGWLLAIARNKTVDAWRAHGGYETLESELGQGGALAAAFGIHAPTTPSRALLRRRRATALREALAELSLDDRELIELRFALDLKPRAIAEILENRVGTNTISQRIVRATRRLREELVRRGVTR